jgi:hypothetical protein
MLMSAASRSRGGLARAGGQVRGGGDGADVAAAQATSIWARSAESRARAPRDSSEPAEVLLGLQDRLLIATEAIGVR